MGVAIKLYEKLADAVDDQTRIRLLAEAIGQLEEAWPRAEEIARRHDVRESELRLQKEIEIVRGENKDMELRLRKEIKQVVRQIHEVRLEVQHARVEIKATEASLRTAIHRQTLWVVGAVSAVVGLIRVLEWLVP